MGDELDIARDTFVVPIIPNRPLGFVGEGESFGEIALRENSDNALIENAAFDVDRIQYDSDYQNNQALSAAFTAHMENVLKILKQRYPAKTRVVEVGCGKGDFLELLQTDGTFEITGYDGAYEGDNPAIEKRFLCESDHLEADLVVLRHVLEHIQQPHEFLLLLNGIFDGADVYIEVPEFDWIRSNQAFFDITYEHVNYFTVASLSNLFESVLQHGLLFGDQYQYAIGSFAGLNHARFRQAYETETLWAPLEFDSMFPDFERIIADIDAASADSEIYVWGAATKGVMFCHHVKRLSPATFERIRAAIDINPRKTGKYMPSVHLPIFDIDSFNEQASGNELILIMNPNYEHEIVAELERRSLGTVRHISI